MSELGGDGTEQQAAAAETQAAGEAKAEVPKPSLAERSAEAEQILTAILQRMGFSARYEFKDAADGTLLVAVQLQGEVPPSMLSTKRSSPIDALQLLVNKIVNRPGTPRRWLQLGVNGFPEPRPSREARQKAAPSPAPAHAAQPTDVATGSAPGRSRQQPARQQGPDGRAGASAQPPRQARAVEPEERTLEAPEDAALTAAAHAIAEKSARLGRYFAIVGATGEQRIQLLRGGEGVPGVTMKSQGEGFLRRVVYTPAKVVPLPRRPVMPDFDDEDE